MVIRDSGGLKVLMAIAFYPRGGSAQVVRYLARALTARGHNVLVDSFAIAEEELKLAGVQLIAKKLTIGLYEHILFSIKQSPYFSVRCLLNEIEVRHFPPSMSRVKKVRQFPG